MKRHLLFFLSFSLFVFFWGVVCAADLNTQQDIVTKSKQGDLLTSPPKRKITTGGDALSSNSKNGSGKAVAPKTVSAQSQPAEKAESVKPGENYLDVYIGRCQYTDEAIAEVRRFAAQRQNLFVRFYGMKTQSDVTPNIETLKGLEIYLPIEAKSFDITTVPTFVLNTKGVTYKISGATELTEIYEQIQRHTAKGQKKNGYMDLGDQGRGCPAVIPDLRPSALSIEQRQQLVDESVSPDMRGVLLANRVSVRQSSQPVYIEKQMSGFPPSNRFIVFSKSQTDWALREIKQGTSTGCCTDCIEVATLWPYAQYCTRELLAKLGVSAVPTIITFHPGIQR
jgi:hypothetical protein